MTTHLLTESDCDTLRTALIAAGHYDALKLLDQARSDSFLRRAYAKSGIPAALAAKPATARRKTLGLRLTR